MKRGLNTNLTVLAHYIRWAIGSGQFHQAEWERKNAGVRAFAKDMAAKLDSIKGNIVDVTAEEFAASRAHAN